MERFRFVFFPMTLRKTGKISAMNIVVEIVKKTKIKYNFTIWWTSHFLVTILFFFLFLLCFALRFMSKKKNCSDHSPPLKRGPRQNIFIFKWQLNCLNCIHLMALFMNGQTAPKNGKPFNSWPPFNFAF